MGNSIGISVVSNVLNYIGNSMGSNVVSSIGLE